MFGGEERRFDEAECAFFLHDAATIEDGDRCFAMAPEDFSTSEPEHGDGAGVPHEAGR